LPWQEQFPKFPAGGTEPPVAEAELDGAVVRELEDAAVY